MKESNFHNIANAKPTLQIAKRKTGAWISHRRIWEVSGKQAVGSSEYKVVG